MHNTAQNSSDNFPSYPSDNHRSSDDVYWWEGGLQRTHAAFHNACVCWTLLTSSR